MGRYDAILFDFDGVLLDTEPVHHQSWRYAVKVFGIQIDWPTYQKFCIGMDDAKVVGFLAGLADPPATVADLWEIYPRKRQLFLELMAATPPFPEETVAFLESLQRYKLAVVSSSDESEIKPILEAGKLRRFFDCVVCAGDVERRKPAPDPYLLAASLLKALSPLVVEDSDAGVQSGLAAGFEVFRVSSARRMPQEVREKLLG